MCDIEYKLRYKDRKAWVLLSLVDFTLANFAQWQALVSHYIDWLDTKIECTITDGHQAGLLGKWMSANVMITTLSFKFREVCETLNENSLCWPNWGFPLGRSENHQGRGSVCECYGWDQGAHSLILWVIAGPSWIKSSVGVPYGKKFLLRPLTGVGGMR